MKAKTTKFFAMLAVFAVAFAGIALLVQEQSNDADAVAATTSETYSADYASTAGIVKIQLEDEANAMAVVPYQPKVGDTDATVIEIGMAYYVNTTTTITLPKITTAYQSIMFFVLDGVQVTFEADKTNEVNGGVQLINVASEEDGVITLQKARNAENKNQFDANGYAKTATTEADYLGYGAVDVAFVYAKEEKVTLIADSTQAKMFKIGTTGTANLKSSQTITGEIETVNFTAKNIEATMIGFSGTLSFDGNSITVKNFTGKIKSMEDVIPGASVAVSHFYVTASTSGAVTGAAGIFQLGDGIRLTFENGATINDGSAFGYVDEYGDLHTFGVTSDGSYMTVGMAGYSIYAGTNMIGVAGTVTINADATFEFEGNATLSGTVYTKSNATTSSLDIVGTNADVKIQSFQVANSGAVKISSSVLVMANSNFVMTGSLTVAADAVLKVAEGASVRTEGALILTAGDADAETPTKDAQVWNAGRVYASAYKTGAADAEAPGDITEAGLLFSIYMNSKAGPGIFYKGSEVFNSVGEIRVVSDAYGAYLDMTGKNKVNLTSGAISVDNQLYKYYTMILATYDNTISMIMDFDNQYPADVSLSGKTHQQSGGLEKSVTFSDVKWDAANNAIIKIDAPETYQVKLVDENNEPIVSVYPGIEVVVKNAAGTVIPIPKTGGEAGVVELVFGEKYTVTGQTDTSNYEFTEVTKIGGVAKKLLKDLKKDTQVQGSFTMIRNLNVDTNNDNKEIPVIIQITEGKATEITVVLTDAEGRIAAGEVVLTYSVDGGKSTNDVVKPETGDVKMSIFSNQVVLLKGPTLEFFTFAFDLDPDQDGSVAVNVSDLSDNETVLTTALKNAGGWTNAFKIIDDETSEDEPIVTGTIGETCLLNKVSQIVYLDLEGTLKTQTAVKVSFTFSNYYQGNSKHAEVVSPSWVSAGGKISVTVDTYVGEVYSISWTDVSKAWEKMEYTSATVTEAAEYTEKTSVPVDAYAREYTLSIDDIEYVSVKNSTLTSVDVSDKRLATELEVAAGKTVKEAIEQINDNVVRLSIEGSYIISWSYSLTYDGMAANATPITGTVTGSSEVFNFLEYGEDKKVITGMEITNINSEKFVYLVKTQPKDHMSFDGRTSTAGYFGDTMYIYTNVDPLYVVENVRVYKELKDGTPSSDYFLATKEDGYFKYTLPAYHVVLVPEVESDYGVVTFVNNGEKIYDTQGKTGGSPFLT